MEHTGNPLRVYTLDDLPQEVVSVVFAKTSRVPDSFDAIAKEMSRTASSDFHEKWVVGYGHSSVAEHAVLSIAIENISILGAKVVEENRLSSFTEKSTRYQIMDPENYYTPPAYADGAAGDLYRASVVSLYLAYADMIPRAQHFCEQKYSGKKWKKMGIAPRSRACDMLRGLLPAAAKTNLGWTVNARSLRHALVKMASQPLAEIRDLGSELTRVCVEKVPTLLKYTERSPYLADWEARITDLSGLAHQTGPAARVEPGVSLVSYDPSGEDDVLSSILFRSSGRSYADVRSRISQMPADARRNIMLGAVSGIDDHEAPVREFENTYYTFEIVCDFGAYRDIQRHRMTTQTQQPLTCELGYTIPDDAEEAGLSGQLARALDYAGASWAQLADGGMDEAQYAVPLAFHKRFLITMNLREAYHLVRLRARVQGHESYRRLARQIKSEIERVHPTLGSLIRLEEAAETVSAERIQK